MSIDCVAFLCEFLARACAIFGHFFKSYNMTGPLIVTVAFNIPSFLPPLFKRKPS